jgi:polyisoprenoid-binding protein YceI
MKNLIIILSIFASQLLHAQGVQLKVTNFSVKFKIKNAGIGVTGYFKNGSAQITYDEKKIENSKFVGTVVSKSINTGMDLRDGHLRDKAEFFEVEKFPEIKMESTKITNVDGKLNITWNLTMKGITKSFTVPAVAVIGKDGVIMFASNFKLNRRNWEVGGKSFILADNLDVMISVSATK